MDDANTLASAADRARPLLATISGTTVSELEVKRSRFITYLIHVDSVADAEARIAALRKEYWDARHHCVALVVGPHGDQQRSNDDGEPAGTAGMPMLEVLRKREITDVVAVVVRYFGGTLLGAGGLMRAYKTAVSQALDSATTVRRAWQLPVRFAVSMSQVGRVENALRSWCERNGAAVTGIDYDRDATVHVTLVPDTIGDLHAFLNAEIGGDLPIEAGEWVVADSPTRIFTSD